MTYLTAEQIDAGIDQILASPQAEGRLEMIIVRPTPAQRALPQAAWLSPEAGVDGDHWAATSEQRLPDGRPDPVQQVSLMNARLLRLLAGGGLPPDSAGAQVEATHAPPGEAGLADRMALAGDNLIVDLDLSAANLPPGQRLAAGEALLEVTDAPHTGCKSFAQRFGPDAVRYINAAERKAIHLRGRYCRVLRAGTVRVGDLIRKVD